jgi:NitT/TauT family transport system substrate-binding protein
MQCTHGVRWAFFAGDEMRARILRFVRIFRGAWSGFALILLLPGNGAAEAPAEIRLGSTHTALLVWIAQEQGLFASNGIAAQPRMYSSGIATAEALIRGEIDLATSSESAFMSVAFTHPDLRILASIAVLRTARLIGRRDRQIAEPGDLVGKRIGVTLNTASEFFLARYLALHGIEIASVTIVDLKPEDIANGLVTGTLDAGLTWDPFITEAENVLKGGAVLLPEQVDQFFFFVLYAREEWVEKNPQAAKAILAALIEAESFASRHSEAAKRIVQKKFGYRSELMDGLWPQHNLHVSLPQALIFSLEVQARWRITKKIAPSEDTPRFLDFILTGPLAGIRPNSVGIVK